MIILYLSYNICNQYINIHYFTFPFIYFYISQVAKLFYISKYPFVLMFVCLSICPYIKKLLFGSAFFNLLIYKLLFVRWFASNSVIHLIPISNNLFTQLILKIDDLLFCEDFYNRYKRKKKI